MTFWFFWVKPKERRKEQRKKTNNKKLIIKQKEKNMARPVKLGLDYFPTDTDILKNIKIRKLIRKYRELGFVLYLQLLTDIYRNSYFIELSDEYIFDLADQFHKRDKTILEMIDFMVEVDLFNKNLRNSLCG